MPPAATFVLFLSGHGFTIGERYYFLPREFTKGSDHFGESIRRHGIPSDVLGQWVEAVSAIKRVIILDTCNSGSAIEILGKARNPFALEEAIVRLGRTQGVFVIAAAPETEDAREVRSLKHGLLTYSLLAGLDAVDEGPLAERSIQPSNPERVVAVDQWFGFAAENVPALYKLYLGTAQDVTTYTTGTPFPVLPLLAP